MTFFLVVTLLPGTRRKKWLMCFLAFSTCSQREIHRSTLFHFPPPHTENQGERENAGERHDEPCAMEHYFFRRKENEVVSKNRNWKRPGSISLFIHRCPTLLRRLFASIRLVSPTEKIMLEEEVHLEKIVSRSCYL